MRAVRVKVIGPEKRVRPYQKCVRPYRETRSAKSMRVNNRMQNFVFFNVINESENSATNLSTLANCPLQNYFSRQLTTTMKPERKRTLLKNAEVYKFI